MKATRIKTVEAASADQALYHCEPDLDGHEFVVVSASIVPFSGPETYIFPADSAGRITDYGELEGSQRNCMSHTTVLEDIGYTVIGGTPPRGLKGATTP